MFLRGSLTLNTKGSLLKPAQIVLSNDIWHDQLCAVHIAAALWSMLTASREHDWLAPLACWVVRCPTHKEVHVSMHQVSKHVGPLILQRSCKERQEAGIVRGIGHIKRFRKAADAAGTVSTRTALCLNSEVSGEFLQSFALLEA
jgi:hypothetical protein